MKKGDKVIVVIEYPSILNTSDKNACSRLKDGVIELIAVNEAGRVIKLVGDSNWYKGYNVYQVEE